MSALGGGFNRSRQHLLILSDWEVSDGPASIVGVPTLLGRASNGSFVLDCINKRRLGQK